MYRLFTTIFIALTLTLTTSIHAQGENGTNLQRTDTIAVGPKYVINGDTIQAYQVTTYKPNLYQRLCNYFDATKPERIDGKIDFSFIGGPHYSSDTKLGLALAASYSYRSKAYDPATPNSHGDIYVDGSLSGFYNFGAVGAHIFAGDKIRATYKVDFMSFPTKFWGIGWDNGHDANNETRYTDRELRIDLDLTWRLASGIYFGPTFVFQNIQAKHIKPQLLADGTLDDRLSLWEGQPLHTQSMGIGAVITLDTRDNMTAPTRGHYILIRETCLPRFIGNDFAFSMTHLWMSGYKTVWNGGVVAGLLQLKYQYGNPPWGMLAHYGGSRYMRGYYYGRYRDKVATEATLELRQHIFDRYGAAAWLGVGSVSHDLKAICGRQLLPFGGVGLRVAIRRNTNVRFDFGIGRNSHHFCFNMNEAF